jgi:hypothetical protein
MTTVPADGMPSTRGTNFYLADPNLAFGCAMAADDLARARPHLIALGEVAGGELDALAGVAASVFTAAEYAWLPALVDWTTGPVEALAEPAGGG